METVFHPPRRSGTIFTIALLLVFLAGSVWNFNRATGAQIVPAFGANLLLFAAFSLPLPVIAYRLLRSIDMLRAACAVLRTRSVVGITANADRMRTFVEHSIGIVTALVPVLGYETATDIARTALESGRGVFDVVLERGLLTRAQLDEILNPAAMTAPRSVS